MKRKRLTIKRIEEIYRELEAAEMPEKTPSDCGIKIYRDSALNALALMVREMEYAKVKSLKLKEEGVEDDRTDSGV